MRFRIVDKIRLQDYMLESDSSYVEDVIKKCTVSPETKLSDYFNLPKYN